MLLVVPLGNAAKAGRRSARNLVRVVRLADHEHLMGDRVPVIGNAGEQEQSDAARGGEQGLAFMRQQQRGAGI